MTDYKEMAERTTIIRVPCGSTVHGLHVPGTDDRDEMGVCVEDAQCMLGFDEFDQYIYRTATERTGKIDAPSQPGDLDLTIYSLRKFLRLALQGNPQLLQLLFVPESMCITRTAVGQRLQELAPFIISKQAGARYLGYMQAQRYRLLGERGQKNVKRPELEEKYGYDTKYAMHVLRLCFQGVEMMSTGKITIPMKEPDRTFTYAVRRGEYTLQEALTKAGELERELKDLIANGPLMDTPDRDGIEKWMIRTYEAAWEHAHA
jgi:predicted nucleotidyltransferase